MALTPKTARGRGSTTRSLCCAILCCCGFCGGYEYDEQLNLGYETGFDEKDGAKLIVLIVVTDIVFAV